MKRFIYLLLVCVMLGQIAAAGLTYGTDYYQKNRPAIGKGAGTADPVWWFMHEVDGLIADLDPEAFAPTAIVDLESIAFAAQASTITLASDDDDQDLTIRVTGATDSSLILSSAGTAADALQIIASAGGIDITAAGGAGKDIDIVNTAGSINLTAGETAADAIKLTTAAGGIQIACGGNLAVTVTGAGTYQGTWLPAGIVKKTITTSTLTTADCGYVLQVAQDAQTITLPPTAEGGPFWIMATAADGGALLTITPNASDKFIGAGLTPSDGEAILLTKATMKKGDYIKLLPTADGYYITEMVGVWAEASP